MDCQEIIKKLEKLGDPKNIAGMRRFGITFKKAFGVKSPEIEKLAKKIGRDHKLAIRLWNTGIYEARILAGQVADPLLMAEVQMEKWVGEFDSWAVCDSTCGKLLDKSPLAWKKVFQWPKSEKEFVRRTGFALTAWLAVHDKKSSDEKFIRFFPVIKKYATDERNFVRKAVNWALRQIGKRNKSLNKKAISLAKEIQKINSKSARWIASDALRELNSPEVKKRLK